jgi:hypothetical protein
MAATLEVHLIYLESNKFVSHSIWTLGARIHICWSGGENEPIDLDGNYLFGGSDSDALTGTRAESGINRRAADA